MTDFDLRDQPSKELLTKYQGKFENVDAEAVLLYLEMRNVYRKSEALYQSFLEKYNLTEAKFIVLMLLYREETHSLLPSELAEGAGSTRATMTGVIQGMEKNGLVCKESVKLDKRSVQVVLTNAGKNLLKEMLPENYQFVNVMMSHLTEKNKVDFSSLLDLLKLGLKDVGEIKWRTK